jgi:hypothetical protein
VPVLAASVPVLTTAARMELTPVPPVLASVPELARVVAEPT